MHLSMLVPLAIWLFASATTAIKVGEWGIYDFTRRINQDGTLCEYRFNISESGPPSRESSVQCVLTVDAKSGSCLDADFSNVWCQPNTQYRVNGGHNATGKFWVFTVNNIAETHNSFPAYQDWEIEVGHVTPERIINAYLTGTFDDSPPSEEPQSEGTPPELVMETDGPSLRAGRWAGGGAARAARAPGSGSMEGKMGKSWSIWLRDTLRV